MRGVLRIRLLAILEISHSFSHYGPEKKSEGSLWIFSQSGFGEGKSIFI